MSRLHIVVLGCAIAGCTRAAPPVEPLLGVRTETSFTLRLGAEAILDGTSLRLRFVSVPADSRCPLEAACVWQGDAQVLLRLQLPDGRTQPLDLHTGVEPHSAVAGGYHVLLEDLQPYPSVIAPTPQARYEAKLRILPARDP